MILFDKRAPPALTCRNLSKVESVKFLVMRHFHKSAKLLLTVPLPRRT
jgi:hypothetical protein